MELPPELWLAIMRELDCMRDHRAFALTCTLFAALARGEQERAKLRLARLGVYVRALDWECGDFLSRCYYTVIGPFLANGQMHGRCCARTSDTLICFEAYDGKRQGEARVWIKRAMPFDDATIYSWANAAGRFDQGLERSWHGQPFCGYLLLRLRCRYIDDKLDGKCISFDPIEYNDWYCSSAPAVLCPLGPEPFETENDVDCSLYHYEDGKREGYGYFLWVEGIVIRTERWERGVAQCINHVRYGRDGFAVCYYHIEDGQTQGMVTVCSLSGCLHRVVREEHGRNEGWSIIYGSNGGAEAITYFEDDRCEGHGYFWTFNSVGTAHFRRGLKFE